MAYKARDYKKFLATAASATLVASAVVPTASAASLEDATGQYKEAVDYVTSEGIANGVGNASYGVQASIKRGDAAVMVAKAIGLDVAKAPASTFTDLNDRVKNSVNALYAAGIINGKSKTSFAPDDNISRVEMAKILTNAYKLTPGTVKNQFADVNSNWDRYVDALLNHGITKGINDKEFGSAADITRGQFALFVYRSKDLVVDTKAPVLNYVGEKTINVAYNAYFTLPAVSVSDNVDKDLKATAVIKDSNGNVLQSIDTTKPGTYTVTYSAQDKAGNKATDLVITVVVASQSGGTTPPPPTPPVEEGEDFTLSLMHTNDTHSYLENGSNNVAKRITAIKEVRAEKPEAVLVDAGDVFSGTLYFNEYKGQADLAFMNLAGYDMMTFGNHEFDLGSSPEGHKALSEFVKNAEFPFVSSNVDFSKDENFTGLVSDELSDTNPENGKIHNAIVKNVDGEKVGFFGLTTEETSSISSPEKITFKNYVESAQNAVNALQGQGVNKIVAVSHLGFDDNVQFDNDLELAKLVDGIDVIVGGHSHTQLDSAVTVDEDENGKAKDPTIIVQAYQYSDFLGTVDVQFDDSGVVVANTAKLIKVNDKAEDAEAKELLSTYSAKIQEIKNSETGAIASYELPNPRGEVSVRNSETALGNLITDAMLAKAKEFAPETVIAMQNGGGIRAAIDAGPITLGDILTVHPYGNTLATMNLTGEEILAALEHSVSQAPKESGGFLHISGMKFTYDNTKPAGERVVSVDVEGENGEFTALDPKATYTVATNAFTAKGGDSYDVFKAAYQAGRVTDYGYADWETIRDYVVALGTVAPVIEGRILEVNAPTTAALRILGTSDIHTNIVNYDYYKDAVSNSLGLAKTATLIKQARVENPNTLLFDNGDSIQGTPLGSYKQAVDKLEVGEDHPSVKAMEILGYDGATLGNHEFNYGLEYLDEVMDDADYPYVNANIRDAITNELMFTPYEIIEKEVVNSKGQKSTVKVGVTGIVPPQILKWDKSHLTGKVTVDDSVNAVEAVIPEMQAAGADVIVVLSHSGFGDATHEEGEEDVTYLLTQVEGVDAIITGHAHSVFPGKLDLPEVDVANGTINGVPVVMPGKFGDHLGVIDLQLKQNGEAWEVVSSKAQVRKITAEGAVDQSVVEAVKEAHEGTIEYVRQPVGETTADIHSYFSQVQDDPSIQIVNDAQKIYVGNKLKGTEYENLPVLSAAAPFKAGTRSDPNYYTYIPTGTLAIKNVADLYLYDNTLAVLKVTGADIKEWLEMSAGQFNQIDPAKAEEQQLINTNFRSYNYDVIDGVTYDIDVTQPAKYDTSGNLIKADSSRIINLKYNGVDIDPDQEFMVATNNYRANGTFPGVRNADFIEIYPDENRQAIIDYIIAEQTIDPSADGNYKLALPVGANVVFESSLEAQKVLPSNIKFIGEGTDGFGKYSIE